MKLYNKTKYDTQYLRRLFKECEKHIFATYLKHGDVELRRVSIQTHRARWVGGYAWLNSKSIVIKLPPPVSIHLGIKTENKVSARRVAAVYLHEVGHNLGLDHKQMLSSFRLNVSWWPDELVPLKVVKEKPKVNLIEFRAAKAQKKLEEWQRKVKQASKLVKKYQCQVRYYEKKMAANNGKGSGG